MHRREHLLCTRASSLYFLSLSVSHAARARTRDTGISTASFFMATRGRNAVCAALLLLADNVYMFYDLFTAARVNLA